MLVEYNVTDIFELILNDLHNIYSHSQVVPENRLSPCEQQAADPPAS